MSKIDNFMALMRVRKEINRIGLKANDEQLQRDLYRVLEEISFASNNYIMEGEDKMNQIRRKRLAEARNLLNRASEIISDITFEEDDAFNNLSEGLQQTMRGETMENNISELEDCADKIGEAIDCLDNVE